MVQTTFLVCRSASGTLLVLLADPPLAISSFSVIPLCVEVKDRQLLSFLVHLHASIIPINALYPDVDLRARYL